MFIVICTLTFRPLNDNKLIVTHRHAYNEMGVKKRGPTSRELDNVNFRINLLGEC